MSDAQELSEQLDLEQWFEREGYRFKTTRGASGPQINAQDCPARDDARWRVYLNAESGIGNCFVCNARFNKLNFIHRTLGSDPDDTSPIGRRAWGETFNHVRGALKEQGWRPRHTVEFAVSNAEVQLPTSFALPNMTGQNLRYLEDRGINAEYAKYFHLRYCPDGKFYFPKEDGTQGWQDFAGRVIIPVYDLDGVIKTFQGRDVTGLAGDKKYLFPKGLPGTGRYLYNGQAAVLSRRVCMGEGAFDVAAIKIAFDGEPALRDVVPVGSFGKHLSYGSTEGDDQLGRFIQLKKRYLQEITIMWDGEEKALIAALDAAELLRKIGLRVRIALLPPNKDPNEVPPDVVRLAFQNATPFTFGKNVEWRLRNPYSNH